MEEAAGTHRSDTHFAWEPPARDISILLNLDLVDRLQGLIRESPGQEIGGLLLGRCDHFQGATERRIVVVEDFEPVESEQLRQPAFSLSPQDSKRLERTLTRARANSERVPVGFFRSHLRKGIYLDEADFSLFKAHFAGPCDVFLVARPQGSEAPLAGFFYWQDDTFERRTSYLQFPLDRARLQTGGFHLVPGGGSVFTDPQPRAEQRKREPAAIPAASGFAASRAFKRAVYGTIGTALVLTAVLCAVMLRSGGEEVSLSVERDGPTLRLSWDAGAPTIAHANSAMLVISDGGKQRRVQLDADQLKVGSLVYTPNSADVNFRMDLLKVSVQGSESVHYVADKQAASGPPEAAAFPAPAPAPQPVAQASEPPRAAPRQAARPKRVSDDDDEDADRAAPSKRITHLSGNGHGQQPVQTRSDSQSRPPQEMAKSAAPILPQPPSVSPAVQPAPQTAAPSQAPLQQAVARPHAEPVVNVSTRAIPPRHFQDLLTKVPLMRTFHSRSKDKDQFVPPRPSHQVTPHLPARLAHVLPGDWKVELKVSVDAEGRVKEVDLLSPGSDDRLVEISAEAMRQWRFEPARFRDKPVHCELVTTFLFRNPNPDGSLAQR